LFIAALLQFGYTPLIAASDKGHAAVVKILLEAGANKEACNKVSVRD
jgi:ankyrin repeat protein